MIPANEPYFASFKQERNGETTIVRRAVVAWDDDGIALVADYKSGTLRTVHSFSGFAGILRAPVKPVSAIPGGGWTAVYKAADGKKYAEPLIAWVLSAEGSIEPVSGSRDGVFTRALLDETFDELVPPGEKPAIDEKAQGEDA